MKRLHTLACRLGASILVVSGLFVIVYVGVVSALPNDLSHFGQGAGQLLLGDPATGVSTPGTTSPPGLHSPQALAQLHVMTATADHLVVEFAAPDPIVEQLAFGGRSFARVAVPGLGWLREPGRPQAPVAWMLIALPLGTHAELRLLADNAEMLLLPQPPIPVPFAILPLQDAAGRAVESVERVLPPAPGEGAAPLDYIYAADDPSVNSYPSMAADVGAPVRWRSQLIAVLRVYPVQVFAAQRGVRFHRRLQVEVRFVRDAGWTAGATAGGAAVGSAAGQVQAAPAHAATLAPSEGMLEPLVMHMLANAELARAWRLGRSSADQDGESPPNSPSPAAAIPASADRRWWKIQVSRQGLYQIACDQLAPIFGAGAPDLAGLQLYSGAAGEAAGGREVALRQVDANHNGHCDGGEGDAIEFWSGPGGGRYDARACYWLTVGPEPGLRMVLRPSVPGATQPARVWRTLLAEENHYYRSAVPLMSAGSGAHDHWFWSFLAFGSNTFPAVHEFPFMLGTMVETDAMATASAMVSVTLAGLDGAHRVQVSINGVWLGDLTWQDRLLYEASLAIPPGILHPGENSLRLALAAAQDVTSGPLSALVTASPVLVDRFVLRYRLPQPAQLDGDSSPPVIGVEPGRWQLAFVAPAANPVTLLDIGAPLHPVEIAPANGNFESGNTWGIAGEKEGIYGAVAASARLAVESIEEDTPSQWRSPANGADYILIAHRSLWAAAQRLADRRRQQGLRVALVDVQDVYDEFSGGQVDASAIHSLLAYAYEFWQPPAPAYVLLLGDGTFDPRGYCATGGACPEIVTPPDSTLIPPYLAGVDAWLGETATDNRLAALEPGSNLPWLAIGRLPANNSTEAQAMVDKIVAYENAAPTVDDDSSAYLALVSDNAYTVDGALDPAGNFWLASDAALALAQHAAASGMPLAAQRFYLNVCDSARFPHCLLPNPPYHPYADAPNLIAGLAAWLAAPPTPRPAEARLLVHYVGHGSITSWAGQPLLLQAGDVAKLGLAPRLPLLLDMTCYTGYFHFPGLPSLAEAWLVAPQHGAVAVIASSGLGLAESHATLDFALLTQLVGRDATTVGQALLAAKLAAAAGGLPADVDTFHLFGDPAMPLHAIRPSPTGTPLPPPAVTPAPTPDCTPDPDSTVYLPWLAADKER